MITSLKGYIILILEMDSGYPDMTAEFPTICPFGECSAVVLKIGGRSHAYALQAVLSSWMLSIAFTFLFILGILHPGVH